MAKEAGEGKVTYRVVWSRDNDTFEYDQLSREEAQRMALLLGSCLERCPADQRPVIRIEEVKDDT